MKEQIEQSRGYSLSDEESEALDNIEKITFESIDKVFSINPVYTLAKFAYEIKNNKRLEDRVQVLEQKLNIKLEVNTANSLELYQLINNYLYSPVELDGYVLDNILDILSDENFDNDTVHEFLNYSIYDINKISNIANKIYLDAPNRILRYTSSNVENELSTLLFLESKNYVVQNRFGGSMEFGSVNGTTYNNGYRDLTVTREGWKFFSLFFNKDLAKYTWD